MAYLLPFLSSLLYVLAALFLKDAAGRGVGLWRMTATTNLFCAVGFNALWFLGGSFPGLSAWWQPALVGALFLAGQVFGFTALQRGDVSVATPVMGVKVVLVALFVTLLLGERVPAALWAAALLSSAGILFLGGGSASGVGRAAPAVGYGILSAGSFALFDVLVQKWSPAWGAGRFLPVMMLFTALYTLLVVVALRKPLGVLSAGGRRPLYLGASLIALQAILLISALALYSKATTINIVYSARGLWSVLAVWSVGRWFGNLEGGHGAAVLGKRLVGALLLMAAIILAAWAP